MKSFRTLVVNNLAISLANFGCGRSGERLKELSSLQSEITRLHEQLPPLMDESGKVGTQIRNLKTRRYLSPVQVALVESAAQ